MKKLLVSLFFLLSSALRVLSEPSQCPDNFKVVYLAQDSMPLCYDEYVNNSYIDRITEAFNNVFDYNADGMIDIEKAYNFLLSEKLGLILVSAKNKKYLDIDGYFHDGVEEELSEQFPSYEILKDSEFYGVQSLAILDRPAWIFYKSLTYNYETDRKAQEFRDKLWELVLKVTDMETFPFLLRLGIQGDDAKWRRYQSFSFEAVPCDRDCITEDLFYLALLTLRNEINDLSKSAALSLEWGWKINGVSELDILFPEFRALFEDQEIPIELAENLKTIDDASSLKTIELDSELTEIFHHQVEVAVGTVNDRKNQVKNKKWDKTTNPENILKNKYWVKFVTTRDFDVLEQTIYARIGCEPQRLIIENPTNYFDDYKLHPYDIEIRKIKNDAEMSSFFHMPIMYAALGKSTSYLFLDCSMYSDAQDYLRVEQDTGIEDIFSETLPIIVLADYPSEIRGWNISFVKKIVALVMTSFFLFLFLYDRRKIYFLVTVTFLLEIAKELMVDWQYAALLQWVIVPYLVTILSESNNQKVMSVVTWLFRISVFTVAVGLIDTILYKMAITDELLAHIAQGSAFVLILMSILISVFLCLKSIKITNKRSLLGLIFLVPFMFDFGVVVYRIFDSVILGNTYDIEWAFLTNVKIDETYYELYLKVLAAALTGLILVARNDLFQRQAIETQKKLTSAYQRFVPEEILSTLGKNSILELNLGDQIEQNMSILFSDIREFTSTSEKLSPEENFKFINDYLEIMVPIVQKNNGFVDKFIGDAIMAIFPENADDAIKCALEMQSAVTKVNEKISEYLDKELEIGIGVNTGMVRLGTLGALERMEGSVISDAVNLAARVEQLTKQYPENIIVTEFTKMAASNYNFNELDAVQVKGKSHFVKIYGVSA